MNTAGKAETAGTGGGSFTVHAYYRHGHGDRPVAITTEAQADALIDALLDEKLSENSIAALYVAEQPSLSSGAPNHELRIAVNPETRVGGLRYSGTDSPSSNLDQGTPGTWYAIGAASTRDEVWYCYMGHDEDFPDDSELSLDTLRAATRQFLTSGGTRPTAVEWREHSAT